MYYLGRIYQKCSLRQVVRCPDTTEQLLQLFDRYVSDKNETKTNDQFNASLYLSNIFQLESVQTSPCREMRSNNTRFAMRFKLKDIVY